MSEWMPIETAPRDMTEVIGMDARERIFRTWYFAPSSRTFGWRYQSSGKGGWWRPLWWSPVPALPAPPAQEAGDA